MVLAQPPTRLQSGHQAGCGPLQSVQDRRTPFQAGRTPFLAGRTPLQDGRTPLPGQEDPIPGQDNPLAGWEDPNTGWEDPLPAGPLHSWVPQSKQPRTERLKLHCDPVLEVKYHHFWHILFISSKSGSTTYT